MKEFHRIQVVLTNAQGTYCAPASIDLNSLPFKNYEDHSIAQKFFFDLPKRSSVQNFLKSEAADVINYFFKGISYWVHCKIHKKKPQENLYGKLKRLLAEKKIMNDVMRYVKSISTTISKKMGYISY